MIGTHKVGVPGKAEDIDVEYLIGSTYENVKDWVNLQSAGLIMGGDITDNGNGTVAVATGTGRIKTTDSDIGETIFFDWSADSSVSLTDSALNWIYIDYGSGTPFVGTVTDFYLINLHTQMVIGRVYRIGNYLSILKTGQLAADIGTKTCLRHLEIWKFQRASGLLISETGTRNMALTAGVLYCSYNRFALSAQDTSGTDRFSY